MHYFYSNISFSFNTNTFNHNLPADYACFALWKSALPFEDKIREHLAAQFEIILDTEIEWSVENFHENATRIYEEPIFIDENKTTRKSDHANKIGDRRFRLFVIKDLHPKYSYAKSVSGKIELSNLNIVEAKYLFRDWVFNVSGINYAIHSTNSIAEFYYQVPLILGIDIFKEIISGKKPAIQRLSKDLEGANGWKSWKELFELINISTNYLVLRNFEGLPIYNSDEDLDILTDNYQRMASAMGVHQKRDKRYTGKIMVQGQQVPVDIRFIGDNYYDTSWEKDMLMSKVYHNGIFIPRNDHYFFSLLFHSRVQKNRVKDQYKKILNQMAGELNFTWFNEAILTDDRAISELINGFFSASNYHFEYPIDQHVEINKRIASKLITRDLFTQKENFVLKKSKEILRKVLPHFIIQMLKNLRYKILNKKQLTGVYAYQGEIASTR